MPTNVIVTIDRQHLSDLQHVASKLEQAGLQVSEIKDYGLIFGQLEHSKIDLLKGYDEVNDIEEEGHVQLPDPNSDIQ